MDKQDVKEFTKLVGDVLSFYQQEVTEFAVQVYWNALKRFELPAIQKAFGRYTAMDSGGTFAPRPGQIAEMIEGSIDDKAMQAWTKVDRAIRTVGPHQTVVFDDPTIHSVVAEMGGWIRMCETKTEKDLEFVAREFRTRYSATSAKGGPAEWPRALLGTAERHALSDNHTPPPPVVVGNTQKARTVYLSGGVGSLVTIQKLSPAAKTMALLAGVEPDERSAMILEAAVGGGDLDEKS